MMNGICKKRLEIKILLICSSIDMANIVLLLVIIMLVFSVIGITLFRDSIPEHFSNLSTGILITSCSAFKLNNNVIR